MDVYLDTEFIDTGRTVDPISLAFVREDGESLYRIVDNTSTIDEAIKNPWLKENVIPSLPLKFAPDMSWKYDFDHLDVYRVAPVDYIRDEVQGFFRSITATGEPVTLWAWWSPYDFLVYCQLWGKMLDIPLGLPAHICDLRQEHLRLGEPQLPRQKEGKHNALADARHNLVIHETLREIERTARERQHRARLCLNPDCEVPPGYLRGE